jgi:hypothetical protein
MRSFRTGINKHVFPDTRINRWHSDSLSINYLPVYAERTAKQERDFRRFGLEQMVMQLLDELNFDCLAIWRIF